MTFMIPRVDPTNRGLATGNRAYENIPHHLLEDHVNYTYIHTLDKIIPLTSYFKWMMT